MHQQAQESDIIIVNHHLFFADLAVKDDELGGIIPDYDAVIFDEAHDIEDVAGQYFGVVDFELPVRGTDARHRRGLARRKEFGSRRARPHPDHAGRSRRSISSVCSGAPKAAPGSASHEAFLEQHDDAYRDVLRALELVALQLELLQAAPEEAIPLVHRAREIARRLRILDGERATARYVYWIERRGRGSFLQATPIDVSQLLDEKLVRHDRHGGADLRHAGRGRRFRIHESAAGPAQRAHAGGPEPFRLPEAGAALCAADICPIRATRRSPRRPRDEIIEHPDATAGAARSCCSPAISRCA